MTIYIDADACPVTRIAEDIARKHGIPVTLLCDTNHQLTSDYSIMNAARKKDVSSDAAFQHAFNAFYRVRRNAEWRQCYYRLFERAKQHRFSFADVIGSLYVETGNVEASFSSKGSNVLS